MKYSNNQKVFPSLSSLALPLILLSSTFLSACGGGGGEEGADPGVTEYPIAYVKRPIPMDNTDPVNPVPAQQDLRDPTQFNEGGVLYLRSSARLVASETDLTSVITGNTGDVKDVSVSPNGKKLIFSLRREDTTNGTNVPKWNIWEFELDTGSIRRLMSSADAVKGDDVSPHYLPDGRIVFISNRQTTAKEVLLNENLGKGQFTHLDENENTHAMLLHIMDADGTTDSIKQLSFNQSHDLFPFVLSSGEIIFSRWDNKSNTTANGNGMTLYKIDPDGSNLQLVYGAHSHNTGTANSFIQFVRAQELPDGRILAFQSQFQNEYVLNGNILAIDISRYIDNSQPTAANRGLGGTGQSSILPAVITTDGSISLGGRYNSVHPLWDGSGRLLVSMTRCKVTIGTDTLPCDASNITNPAAVEAPPQYGVWMFQPQTNTALPVALAGADTMYNDVVAMVPRTYPSSIVNSFDDTLEGENVGLLHIRSVYDLDGQLDSNLDDVIDATDTATSLEEIARSTDPVNNRRARFLRLVKAVGLPDPDVKNLNNSAFGPGSRRSQGMREILGYIPIEPDGSVMVKVPANVAFTIEILDANGRRIKGRHQNWLQIRAGEKVTCNGCHTHNTSGQPPKPHGRNDALATAVNLGANYSLTTPYTTNLNVVNTYSPVTGETMAETRFRYLCNNAADCSSSITPSANLVYTDVWTDTTIPVNPPVASPDINALYANLTHLDPTTPADEAPMTEACQNNWDANCRIVIQYEKHIEPIWALDPRTDAMANDVKCTTCHSSVNAGGNAQVPASQLNLTNNTMFYPATFIANADHVHSYRELLFNSTQLELNAGNTALVETMVPTGQVDGMGNPILTTVNVPPSMRGSGANNSTRFFSRFNPGGTHEGYLTPDELKLISEWLDIGAQYHNNPFDAP